MRTKSGIMLGLGEAKEEVVQTLKDLHNSRCRCDNHRPVSAANKKTFTCCSVLFIRMNLRNSVKLVTSLDLIM